MRICVTGAGGFIGTHLVRRLKADGHWVRGVDLKEPRWSESEADEFLRLDLRRPTNALVAMSGATEGTLDRVYALAADMGGMGFISACGAEIIRNNTLISVNSIEAARKMDVGRYLFSSSACVYPMFLQGDDALPLKETQAYPALPQQSYGWEKLHAEHLCRWYREAGWLETRIVRFHNCYGPLGSYDDGREKAPAALCRKVALAKLRGEPSIEVWGDGRQVRSYMHVDDCVEGLVRFMESDHPGPLNIGSAEEISVDGLAKLIMEIAGVELEIVHVPGPEGVRRRNSDNSLCRGVLGWEPAVPIAEGVASLYRWVEGQVRL